MAFVTHELRNPLGTAVLALTQLREMMRPSEDQARMLELASRAHDKLAGLIDGVLTVEKGQAGELEPHPVETRLEDVIEDAIAGARERAASRHMRLDVHYDRGVRLRVDPRLTSSAVQNLVDNAIKYGGSGPVEVWSEADSARVSVHVRDRCGGLSKQELQSIFMPFKRGKRHQDASGSGLGLSITKHAVEAQGGSVHAESTGEGCHFWIALPRAEETPPQDEQRHERQDGG